MFACLAAVVGVPVADNSLVKLPWKLVQDEETAEKMETVSRKGEVSIDAVPNRHVRRRHFLHKCHARNEPGSSRIEKVLLPSVGRWGLGGVVAPICRCGEHNIALQVVLHRNREQLVG